MKKANVIYYVPIYVFYTKLYEYFQTISNEIIYRHVDEILKEDPNKKLNRTAICEKLDTLLGTKVNKQTVYRYIEENQN